MRVVWITNGPIGKQNQLLDSISVSGSWIEASLEILHGVQSIELFVVTTWQVKQEKNLVDGNITYTILPGQYPSKVKVSKNTSRRIWIEYVKRVKPDLIHIHGTEYLHGLALVKSFPEMKYLVSLQGLRGIIGRYYFAGLSSSEILRTITLYDIITGKSIIRSRKKFLNHLSYDSEYLNRIENVIGRTTWDYVHAKRLNNAVKYYTCERNLRSVFYKTHWSLERIKRHTLFISQSDYPIKGLHIVLKSLCLLRDEFKDIKLFIAGRDFISLPKSFGSFKLSGYAKYITKFIRSKSLQNNVHFTGILNDVQMAEYYRDSHIFICPSSIENESISLSEAQLIGTPCISSFVGGLPDTTHYGEAGLLYRFEEFEMLAHYIRFIFENDDYAITLSNREKRIARQRHDRKVNMNNLLKIYEDILAR